MRGKLRLGKRRVGGERETRGAAEKYRDGSGDEDGDEGEESGRGGLGRARKRRRVVVPATAAVAVDDDGGGDGADEGGLRIVAERGGSEVGGDTIKSEEEYRVAGGKNREAVDGETSPARKSPGDEDALLGQGATDEGASTSTEQKKKKRKNKNKSNKKKKKKSQSTSSIDS